MQARWDLMSRKPRVPVPSSAAILALLLTLAACDLASAPPDPAPSDSEEAQLDYDAAPITEGEWYRPGPDVTWQWQLSGTLNTDYDVEIYDIDLWAATPQLVDALHADGRRVMCYFSAGSADDRREDFGRFASADVGRPLDGFPRERWLDVRSEAVLAVMLDRLDLAAARGCDGVEPDNVDGYLHETGFEIAPRDQITYSRALANAAHRRGLAVAQKNAIAFSDELVEYVDLQLNESCHRFDECHLTAPYADAGKPVLNVEYPGSEAEAEAAADTLCPRANAAGLRTLLLPWDLDDAFRVSCF